IVVLFFGLFLCLFAETEGIPQLPFDLSKQLGGVFQMLVDILLALAEPLAFIGIPRTARLDDFMFRAKIDELTGLGDAETLHDIHFSHTERRCNLVFYNFDLRAVTHNFLAEFELFSTAYLKPYRTVEFKCTSAWCCFRIAEHHADLFTDLVDEDGRRVTL